MAALYLGGGIFLLVFLIPWIILHVKMRNLTPRQQNSILHSDTPPQNVYEGNNISGRPAFHIDD